MGMRLASHTLLVRAPESASNLSRSPSTVRTSSEVVVKHKETAWLLGSLPLATTAMSRRSIYRRSNRQAGRTAGAVTAASSSVCANNTPLAILLCPE